MELMKYYIESKRFFFIDEVMDVGGRIIRILLVNFVLRLSG